VNGRVDAMGSVTLSQLLDRELSWPEYRVGFLSIHTDTSAGIRILACQRGDMQKRLVYTSRIRRRTDRPNGGQVLALPILPLLSSRGTRLSGSLTHRDD
jgi:hypothetical protein